jgi:hypothetical protein
MKISNVLKSVIGILFSLSVFESCNSKGIDPIAIHQDSYFPTELGNSWDYGFADVHATGTIHWEITDKFENIYTVKRFSDGKYNDYIRIVTNGENVDIILENGQNFSFYRFIKGSTWLHRDNYVCDDSSTLLATVEENLITTPAGSFSNCLRIERKSPVSCMDGGTMVEWWAPNVGLIRRDEITIIGPQTIYLKSYKLN